MMDSSISAKPLSDLTTEPNYFSPHQTIDEVLPLLWKIEHSEVGVVVDEFGSAIGVVSVEDIVEEVLGDISVDDETMDDAAHHRTSRRHRYEILENGAMLLDSRMSLPEVNELLDQELPAGDYHTLGGLLLSRVRQIPSEGEVFEISGLRITVEVATKRGLERLRVEPIDDEPGDMSPS